MVDGFLVGDQQAGEHVDPLEAELDREVEEAGKLKVQEALRQDEQVEIQTEEELEKDKDRQQEQKEERETGQKGEGEDQKPENQEEERETTPATPEKEVEADEAEEEKTPVVQRTEQWRVKGSPVRRGRGRGGGRGRGRGRGNKRSKSKEQVEVVDSEGEAAPDQKREKTDPKKSDNTIETVKKSAPKKKAQKKTEKPPASGGNKNDEDKDPKLVWELVTHANIGKFPWGPNQHLQEPQRTEEGPQIVEEPGGSNGTKRANAASRGVSFARRVCPKTCPSKQRWEVVSEVFDNEFYPWLDFCGFPISPYEAADPNCPIFHFYIPMC